MEKFLSFLRGKKGVIASVIMTTVAYLGARGIMSDLDVLYAGLLVTSIFGGASYATGKILTNNSK